MRKLPLFPAESPEPVQTLLELAAQPQAALRAGSVRLVPNQRVPAEGTSAHGADELSLIVSGSLSGVSGDERFTVVSGDVTLIPAGERHWAVAGPEGAEIFWCWFGELDEQG
ncbi:MAG: AraC family ligand binding domain-containing protein [Trueperaceae bacterium]